MRKKKTQNKKKQNKKNKFTIPFIFLLSLILLVTGLILYTVIFFPQKIQNLVKNYLIQTTKPLFHNEFNTFILFKLEGKPDNKLNEQIISDISQKFGLTAQFKEISTQPKTIEELVLLKNSRPYPECKNIYFYWDDINSKKSLEKKADAEIVQKFIEKKRAEKKIEIIEPEKNNLKNNDNNETSKIELNKNPESKKKEKEEFVPVKLIIVIDDVGYSYSSTYKLAELQIPLTFAIIPNLPQSNQFYHYLNQKGFDILIHIPMEPDKGSRYLEENGIFSTMNNETIQKKINDYFQLFPDAIGANNHMGSKIISNEAQMQLILHEISLRKLFWLDSRTIATEIPYQAAMNKNIPYFRRDVFLDNNKDRLSIKREMDRLISIARKKGYAVGIGHAQTVALAEVLKEYIQQEKKLKFKFASFKEMLLP